MSPSGKAPDFDSGISLVRTQPSQPTKTEHLSTDKCSVFVYPILRLDDIPQQVADDIHAFGVIGMRGCEKLLNYLAKYDIVVKPKVGYSCYSTQTALMKKPIKIIEIFAVVSDEC